METIIFVIGALLGFAMSVIISRAKSIGSLRIDRSDSDDNPYLFLELSKDIDDFSEKKYITLKVNKKDFIPHK